MQHVQCKVCIQRSHAPARNVSARSELAAGQVCGRKVRYLYARVQFGFCTGTSAQVHTTSFHCHGHVRVAQGLLYYSGTNENFTELLKQAYPLRDGSAF